MIKLVHKCLDTGGPTVTANALLKRVSIFGAMPSQCRHLVQPNRHTKGPLILGPWAHWSHGWHCDGPPPDRSTFVLPLPYPHATWARS